MQSNAGFLKAVRVVDNIRLPIPCIPVGPLEVFGRVRCLFVFTLSMIQGRGLEGYCKREAVLVQVELANCLQLIERNLEHVVVHTIEFAHLGITDEAIHAPRSRILEGDLELCGNLLAYKINCKFQVCGYKRLNALERHHGILVHHDTDVHRGWPHCYFRLVRDIWLDWTLDSEAAGISVLPEDHKGVISKRVICRFQRVFAWFSLGSPEFGIGRRRELDLGSTVSLALSRLVDFNIDDSALFAEIA